MGLFNRLCCLFFGHKLNDSASILGDKERIEYTFFGNKTVIYKNGKCCRCGTKYQHKETSSRLVTDLVFQSHNDGRDLVKGHYSGWPIPKGRSHYGAEQRPVALASWRPGDYFYTLSSEPTKKRKKK